MSPSWSGLSLVVAFLFATNARAQRMQLELRPRLGDTLRMRLEQVTEMSGGRKGSANGNTKPVVTTVEMFSRAIVESSAVASALILAVTDSVRVRSTEQQARSVAATQRQLAGRKIRLRLAPDGSVVVADPAGNIPKEVSELVAVMPASFPREPVAVGDSWVREMPIASSATLGVPVGGVVRASFRFDSVSRGGELAYISMRGMLDQLPAAIAVGALTGSVNGMLVVNRRRGWLSESRFLVDMSTTVSPKGIVPAAPMQFRMRITQHMRVVDKR